MKFEEALKYLENGYYIWLDTEPTTIYYEIGAKHYYRDLMTSDVNEYHLEYGIGNVDRKGKWYAAKSIPFYIVHYRDVEIIS